MKDDALLKGKIFDTPIIPTRQLLREMKVIRVFLLLSPNYVNLRNASPLSLDR